MSEDQLRYNADKPRLSDAFASARTLEELALLDDADFEAVADEHYYYLTTVALEIAKYLDRSPSASLPRAILSVLIELENDLSETFEFEAPDEPHLVALLGQFPKAFRELCKVYEYGSEKYERGNYRKGAPVTTYLDSALRHVLAFGSGKTNDAESGCHHMAHALWNLWIACDLPASRDDRLPAVRDWFDDNFTTTAVGDDDDW